MDEIKELEHVVQTDEKIDDVKIVERPISFLNARLEGESFEDYKLRRIQIRKFLRQRKFFQSHTDKNRAARRKRSPLRLTSQLKHVRNKWMVGITDVSYAVKHKIPLHYFLRVAKMGLDINRLRTMGDQISDEIRKEQDGNISNTVSE
ncbi:MAG: hypothetical protein WCT23_10090 [Candidatus Neomarinimicrobiota bacterium]